MINISLEGDNEVSEIYKLHRQTRWVDLEAMLKAQFDCENMEVYYVDSEGDYISLSSQEELVEAFKVADQCHNTLYMRVRNFGSSPPKPEEEEATKTENTELKLATIIPETHKKLDCEEAENPVPQVNPEQRGASGQERAYPRQEKREKPDDLDSQSEALPLYPVKKSKKRHLRDLDRKKSGYHRQREDLQGEVKSEEAIPYPAFIKYMRELKKELHSEIVKDVTRKTVKHVLRGLDGAVLQSYKGGEAIDTQPKGVSATPAEETERNAESSSHHPIYYHCGVLCDNCNKVIVGARYKCCNCVDYDLCEECENINGIHDHTHVFIKLRRPIKFRQRGPLMKQILYKPYRLPTSPEESTDSQDKEDGEETAAAAPMVLDEGKKGKILARIEKLQAKAAAKQEKIKQKQEKAIEKLKMKLDVVKDMKAHFMGDLTIPDGTKVQPGTKFVKTWKIKNSGNISWRESTKLHNISGNLPTSFNDVDVLLLAPGEIADISVTFYAPEKPGKYQSHWKMMDSGHQFGHRVWCLVHVEPKLVLEPSKSEDTLKIVNDESKEDKQEVATLTDQLEEDTEEVKETNDTEFVIEKSPIQFEKKSEEPTPERISNETVQKLEQELSSAAAAMAQLQLEGQSKPTVSGETGQDLMSFEMLDMSPRGSNKMSQTATPNNTPLVVSPPKSPLPEEGSLSRTSSVELLNPEHYEEKTEVIDNEFVENYLSSLPIPPPEVHYSSEEYESLSEDDDFLIVPMPACFDFSKPVIKPQVSESSSDNETTDNNHNLLDDNHNTIVTNPPPSVDDLLTTTNSVSTPPLDPLVSPQIPPPVPAFSMKFEIPVNCGPVTPAHGELREETETQRDIGASGNLDVPSTNTETGEVSATNTTVIEHTSATNAPSMDQSMETGEATNTRPNEEAEQLLETTEVKEALPQGDVCTGGAHHGENDNGDKAAGYEVPVAGEMVNQMVSTAVKAAERAASNAYTTCKEVFYTWQARTYQNATPQDKDEFKPPRSTWKPKADKWKPKEEKWEPKSMDSGPMKKLIEMGFCNRKKNQELLTKHNSDLDRVLAELLREGENDWMNNRH